MTTLAEILVFDCIHRRFGSEWTEDGIDVGICTFPRRSADGYLGEWFDHATHAGDDGIRFTPIPTS